VVAIVPRVANAADAARLRVWLGSDARPLPVLPVSTVEACEALAGGPRAAVSSGTTTPPR